MSKIYPVGIQSFEKIREGGYCYIDKTSLIYSLIKSGQYYFLSRPRRFGKSLLISTLEAYFLGKKELFKGLAMEGLEKDWTTHPVLHLDLNTQKYDTPEALNNVLEENLNYWESLYGASESEIGVARRFNGIIRRAAEKAGQKVVVLVDEYDKPMLQAIGNEPLLTDYRNTLKAFYGALKSNDKYLRFALLTGVTKFSKVSVFSDLNNLMDISLSNRFANICGITENELHRDLEEDIRLLAEANGMNETEARQTLKEWYDGYHFAENTEDIYNPFSLLNTLAEMKFGSYWFETGTPTFLVELLQRSKYDLHRLTEEMATADSLGGIDTMETNPVPILYQSGYLTIKGFDKEFRTYELGFPNKEVEEGFTKFLLPNYASLSSGNPSFEISSFVREVRGGNIDAFMRRLQSFFADTPYELAHDLERHYQNVLFIVFKLLGFYTRAEYRTSNGRIDMVVKTDRYIYVMEFKLDGTAEEAIRQINEKGYAAPFTSDGRTLYKIGVNFSNAIRGIERWIVEE
ncbi:ATP-binding protein [Mediterranea massiliensis]|uniref:ATP-binding protein n=1 Tax=Mediterranea massiliensis TaxID=1841865 RepID=UPI00266B61BF|nr:ATP-binding protein [Mediterranea massiliensis]